jgi:hypothetical protein
MKAIDLINGDSIPVLVYDVSIENIEERKEKVKTYKTIKLASQNLGLSYNVIRSSIVNRKRVYAPMIKKEVAIRFKPSK